MPDQQLIQEEHPLITATLKEPLYEERDSSPTLARILADIAGEAVNKHLDGEMYHHGDFHPTAASSYIRLPDGTVWAVSINKQR